MEIELIGWVLGFAAVPVILIWKLGWILGILATGFLWWFFANLMG